MILQLDPAILVDTPLGVGHALLIIDYRMHQNTCSVVAMQETGIIKHFDFNDVNLRTNYTYGMNLTRNGSKHPNSIISNDTSQFEMVKRGRH